MIKTITEETTQLYTAHNKAFVEITKGPYEGKPLLVPSGVLTNLVNELTQVALQAEMARYLEEDSLEQGSNRRNGITTKTMKTGASPATSSNHLICGQKLGCQTGYARPP